ncbi:MAG: hypothetical protein ABI839_05740 [Verrucomicrobiota bacterium]
MEKPANVAPTAKAKATRKRKGPATRQEVTPHPIGGETNGISDDAIRIRAYFISEARSQFAIPGDAAVDWIEARRQLVDEASREESAALGVKR